MLYTHVKKKKKKTLFSLRHTFSLKQNPSRLFFLPPCSLTLAATYPSPISVQFFFSLRGRAAHPPLRGREIMTGGGPIWDTQPSSLFRASSTALPPPLSRHLRQLSLPLFASLARCLHLSSSSLQTAFVCSFFCLLPESSDGSRLQCFCLFFSSLLLIRFVSSCRWQDLQWLWMLSWQWVWVFLLFRAFFGYPLDNLGVDQSKLSLESPFTRIA